MWVLWESRMFNQRMFKLNGCYAMLDAKSNCTLDWTQFFGIQLTFIQLTSIYSTNPMICASFTDPVGRGGFYLNRTLIRELLVMVRDRDVELPTSHLHNKEMWKKVMSLSSPAYTQLLNSVFSWKHLVGLLEQYLTWNHPKKETV